MNARERQSESDTSERINREQQDEGQAQDVAADAMRAGPGWPESVRGGRENPAQILPDDVPDLVETMNAMVRSGHIDNSAYEGEPMHDDEEGMLGDTEAGGDDPLEEVHELKGPATVGGFVDPDELEDEDAALFNELADGSEDPLAVPVRLVTDEAVLAQVPDTGDDPLGKVSSMHGLEDEDGDDDADGLVGDETMDDEDVEDEEELDDEEPDDLVGDDEDADDDDDEFDEDDLDDDDDEDENGEPKPLR